MSAEAICRSNTVVRSTITLLILSRTYVVMTTRESVKWTDSYEYFEQMKYKDQYRLSYGSLLVE